MIAGTLIAFGRRYRSSSGGSRYAVSTAVAIRASSANT
jgi:hypothetical protein